MTALVPVKARPDYDQTVLEPLHAAEKLAADQQAAADTEAARQAEIERQRVAAIPAPEPTHYEVSYENNYTPGNCTWYVASRVSVPSSMGNATNWDSALGAVGWTISSTPHSGAIGISHDSAMGHVVIVEAVTTAGVLVSEMNYQGLYVVDQRLTSADEFVYATH